MLEGEISQIQLIERLVELWREQFTGAIRFENDGIIKIIYFKGGDILSASTNDRADSIDEILMRAGKVSREHVKQALAKRKENETLGDALLNLGFITRKELTWARRVQVVGVIRSIAAWTDGSFTIVADYLPKRDEGTLFPLPQVLVELIVTEQDRTRFERALDGGRVVFQKTGDFDDVWRRLGLNEDAEAIVRQIDGTKDASAVATASDRDTFNVYKLLHALATLGVLARSEKPQADPEFLLDDFATAGVADAADLWNDPAPVVTIDETPQFELDESEAFSQPTLEIPKVDLPDDVVTPAFDDEPPAAAPVAVSAWDEPDDDEPLGGFETEPEPEEPAVPAPMPAWDSPPPPPRDALSVPVQASIEPPAEAEEEAGWGFDEAQIETARRATIEPPPAAAAPVVGAPIPARRERKRGARGLLLTLLLLGILAGAGWYGWQWLQNRPGAEAAVAAARPQPGTAPMATTPPPANPPATETAEPLPPVTTGVTTTAPGPLVVAPPTTVTIAPATPAPATATTASTPAPAPAPAVITPAPAASQALPRVTARTPASSTGGRERIDAMAREYAANATGNFTVQIQILCDPGNVEKAMRAGGDRLWFVPQTIGARSCYRVFWGRFGTREEAQRALAEVPGTLRDRNSAVKPVPKG